MIKKISQDTGLDRKYFSFPKKEFGDISYNEALKISKERNISLEEATRPLLKKFESLPYVESTSVVNGYINLRLNFQNLFTEFLAEKYNSNRELKPFFPKKDKKVIVEHTSVNPNAPPHIGRARNACIGSTLANILKEYGYNVEVQYYVNDIGKQVSILVYGCMNRKVDELSPKDLLKIYVETSKNMDEQTEKKVIELQKKFEKGDPEIRALFRKIVEKALEAQKEIFSRIGAKYDRFVFESDLLEEAFKILEKIKSLKQTSVENNVISIDLSEFGIEKELVLTRSDGSTLYPLRDIVYHIKKLESAELNYGVYGSDHKLHFEQLKKVLELLGYDTSGIRYVFYEHVLLPEGKMSTRKGTVVLLEDFLEEVKRKALKETEKRWGVVNTAIPEKIAIGSVRYTIGKVDSKKTVVFDINKALNFEGDSGVYIQYTYARAGSILSKAEDFDFPEKIQYNYSHEEKELVKLFWKYEEIIEESAEQLKPEKIYHYMHSLAEAFNKFYAKCPVLNAELEVRMGRLALVKAVRDVLGRAMDIGGIPRLEKI